jgi:hypothetical protein
VAFSAVIEAVASPVPITDVYKTLFKRVREASSRESALTVLFDQCQQVLAHKLIHAGALVECNPSRGKEEILLDD